MHTAVAALLTHCVPTVLLTLRTARNLRYWLETTAVLFDSIARVREELGIEFEFMNIGGGLGIPYSPDKPEVQPAVIAPAIAKVCTLRPLPCCSARMYVRLSCPDTQYLTGRSWFPACLHLRCDLVLSYNRSLPRSVWNTDWRTCPRPHSSWSAVDTSRGPLAGS